MADFEPLRRILGAPHGHSQSNGLENKLELAMARSSRSVLSKLKRISRYHGRCSAISLPVTNYRDLDFDVLQAVAENTNNICKIRMHVHADFSLREVQGLLSEMGGVREIHSGDLVDVYQGKLRGEALIFLRPACTQT